MFHYEITYSTWDTKDSDTVRVVSELNPAAFIVHVTKKKSDTSLIYESEFIVLDIIDSTEGEVVCIKPESISLIRGVCVTHE